MAIITLFMTSNMLIIYRLQNQYKIWLIRTFPNCSLWEHLVVHSRAIKCFLFAQSKCHLETNMNFSLFTISYHFQVSHDNDKARIMHLRMDWGCEPNAPISYLYLLSLIFLIPCVQCILLQSVVSTKLMSFWVLYHSWWVVRTTKPCDKSWLNKCFFQINSSHLAVISIVFCFLIHVPILLHTIIHWNQSTSLDFLYLATLLWEDTAWFILLSFTNNSENGSHYFIKKGNIFL